MILFLKYKFLKISFYVLPFIFYTNTLLAEKTDSLFRSDEIINFELRSDFSAIQDDRLENPQYHDGEMIYLNPAGNTEKFSVKVIARGNFRRNPVNCNFPPLYLNFKKNEVKNTIFDNQDKLKLVTPCYSDKDVIDEYLVYKMYNQVTPLSFKVRLVKILYFDTGEEKKLFEKFSFFLEPDDHVAERNNSDKIDKVVTPYDVDSEAFIKMAFFQYMIGNKDWFVSSRKNIVLMQPEDTTLAPYAVPYDFDFAAFVNADYTKPKNVPDENLPTRRVYKGPCYTAAEYNEAIAFYKSMRPVFESIIKDMPDIPKSGKQQNLEYLDSFYRIIRNNVMIKQEFIDKCETKKDYNIRN
jgi:hypothetical protein